MDKNRFFRAIPKVDTLIEQCDSAGLFDRYGREITVDCIRERTEALREFIGKSEDETEIIRRTESLLPDIAAAAEKLFSPNLKPVVNATGTVLHTNLGRALISRKHAEHLMAIVSGYSNLEYDLEAGARGERYSHFEKLLCKITGAEAAMAVNNNAAAVMLTLSALCRGGEVPVSRGELVELGDKHGLPVIEDIGSGVLIDLSKYGLTYEPTVQESIRAGAAIVCFSGDKLLGGPQAGIIVGRKEYIKKIKKHPLTRAFRIDKFTAAALELTLQEYLSEENAIRNIPVLRMLTQPPMEIRERAEKLAAMLKNVNARVEVVNCESQVGGGSMPLERLRSSAVAIKPLSMTTAAFEEALRRAERPVICRVQEDRALMDMRTVQPGETELIAAEVAGILGVK